MRRIARINGYSLVELLVVVAIAGLIGTAILGVYKVSQDTYIRASSLEAAQVGARAGLDRMANELRLIGSYWVGVSTCPPLPDCNPIRAATSNSITFMANVYDLYMTDQKPGEAMTSVTTNGNTVSLTNSTNNLTASDVDNTFKVYQNPALNDWIYIANGGTREVTQLTGVNPNTRTLTLAPNLSATYPAGSLVRDVKTITYTRNTGNNTLTRTQGGDPSPDPVVDNVTGLTFTYFGTDRAYLGGAQDPGGVREPDTPCGGISGQNPNLSSIKQIRIDLKVQGPDGSRRCMITEVRPRSLP